MVGRTGCRSQALHLLHKEGDEGSFVLNRGLGHGIEIGLVGRAATFGYHHETVFRSLCRLDVDLCGEVAAGVHFVVHVQRGILRVAQVLLGEGVEHTEAQGLFILEACPYLLSFLSVDNRCTCILAEREDAFAGHLGIAEELQGHILIVLAGFWIGQDLSHLFVMLPAEHELYIVESLLRQKGQCLGTYLHDFFPFKFADGYSFFCQ